VTGNGTGLSPGVQPRDIIVECLKKLGGIAQLQDIYSLFGDKSGREMDNIAEAKVRQTLQLCSSDATWDRPKSAPDLFYSIDGVEARSGLWGLRGFSPQSPALYPNGPDRAYTVLLHRKETTLFSMRGIAYRAGKVVGIHVNFGADGDYPDKLRDDGSIDHIGEGKGEIQKDAGGNHGMLNAIAEQYPIPVYQQVAPGRYAPLGEYVVKGVRRESLKLVQDHPTDAFVFSLEPIVTIESRKDAGTDQDVAAFAEVAAISPLTLGAEGGRAVTSHIRRERDKRNRDAVIRAKGVQCEGCDLVFGERYGQDMAGFVEVHHTRPLAAGPYTPTIDDFAVLCANCHRAVHIGRGLTPRSVRELRGILARPRH
jgi:HNH endonuclease